MEYARRKVSEHLPEVWENFRADPPISAMILLASSFVLLLAGIAARNVIFMFIAIILAVGVAFSEARKHRELNQTFREVYALLNDALRQFAQNR